MNKVSRLILASLLILACDLAHAETKKKGKELLLEKREENLIKKQGLVLPEIQTQPGSPFEVKTDTSPAQTTQGILEPSPKSPKSEDRRISVGDKIFNLSDLGPDDYIRFPEEEGVKEVKGQSIKYWKKTSIKASKTRKTFAWMTNSSSHEEGTMVGELVLYDDKNRELFRKTYTDGIYEVFFLKDDEYIAALAKGAFEERIMELFDIKGNLIYEDIRAGAIREFPSKTAFLFLKSQREDPNKSAVFKYDLTTRNLIKIIDDAGSPTFSKTGDYCFYANGKILGYNNSDNLIWQMDYEDKGAGVSRSYSDNNKYFLFRQGSNFKLIDNTTGDIIWEKEVKEVKRDGAVYQIIGGGLSENDTIRVPLRNSNNLEEFKKYDIFALFDLEWNLTGFTKTEKKRR